MMSRATIARVWIMIGSGLLVVGFAGWWARTPATHTWTSVAAMLAVWLSTGLLVVCWWRWSVGTEPVTRAHLAALALAATAPLSMVPLVDLGPAGHALDALLIAGLAVVPLGWLLASRIVDPGWRMRAQSSVLALSIVGVGLGWIVGQGDVAPLTRGLRWATVASITLLPATIVAYELVRGPHAAPMAAQRRGVEALLVLLLGAVPGITGLSLAIRMWPALLLPLAAAAITAAILARFAVLPLARLAANVTVQRDRVVAATESERTRLASALHDGPLADIALLIQRLDDRGDAGSAAIARGVANELRAIGSELRLPILDDLGAGPALEWLVGRLTQRSGVPVRLEQVTAARPPAPVELAAYRVAQEALVNAIKHGAAPISVRYAASTGTVSLSVDDAGPGIDRDAPARADRDGRLGLASMIQRAEAVGAQLTLAARVGGGTHVGLEWRATGS